MRRLLAAGLFVLAALPAAPASAWPEIPPDAAQLNRTADNAASAETAIRLYSQSLQLFPSNGPALYGLGRALLEVDRPADSLKVFRRLDALFPDDPATLEALATALARLPEPRRAHITEGLAFAARATDMRPDSAEAWHVLSVLRHLDGDYVAALDAARQAVALDAQNPSDPETTALYQQQEIACIDALSVFSPLD